MQISTILDHIDSGHMALPEFQRGYVWNRDQVRGLMQSLYRRYPVGSLLVWATSSDAAQHRGDQQLAPGVVKLLLDGQQRMTSLYGIVRGKAPKFFDGNAQTFSGLHFHLENEEFAFYSPVKMRDDKLWVDVSALMRQGISPWIGKISQDPDLQPKLGDYIQRLNQIHQIRDISLHIEEVTGEDKGVDVVVDIFNRVNSGGTKLSKGDLALAKICAESPTARDDMKKALRDWRSAGFHFTLDWLLRNVNTVIRGEAKFGALHDIDAREFEQGLAKAVKAIDYLINLISGRLGLDHDRVFAGRYALPIMTHYLSRRGWHITDAVERDKLLFWYLESAMWGRFSGSTETKLDRDLQVLEDLDGGLDRLIEELRLWRGSLKVLPDHFGGWSRGARFYPVLYLLTRVREARDWGTGVPLKKVDLGAMTQLELHHIFPKAVLYKAGYKRPQVNAVANFCFLTKDTNLQISDRPPAEYFPEIEERFPGALASQWIPQDPELWKAADYLGFLEERKRLLADAINHFLSELLHADVSVLEPTAPEAVERSRSDFAAATDLEPTFGGGVETEEEEEALLEINKWIVEQGLPGGAYLFELTDEDTGAPLAIFDLAWPSGLQEELSEPVALLVGESPELLALANERGYRYFTNAKALRSYVERDVLALDV